MKNKNLQEILKTFPDDAEVWLPVFNNHVETYGEVDEVLVTTYGAVSNDFFGTPGRMDKRIVAAPHNDKEDVLLLSSHFGRMPNSAIDFGKEDVNEDIRTLNGTGDDSDEDLVWHENGFMWNPEKRMWYKHWKDDAGLPLYTIIYFKDSNTLSLSNAKDKLSFQGCLTGTEDIHNAIKACKINVDLYYI